MESQLEPSELIPRHDVDFTGLSDFADPISSPQGGSNPDFNPTIFWSVNAFILFLIFLTILWCCFVQRYVFNGTNRSIVSDQFYRARLQRRRETEGTESPDKRRQKLNASFSRHGVQMTVKEGDVINKKDNDDFDGDSSTKETDCAKDHVEDDGNDIETGQNNSSFSSLDEEEAGQLKLPTGRLVPNCCAVCLSDYQVGDVVTWSSNPKCIHAFHRECVVDWLVKMQPETPCPCCRQEFTDLEDIRRERKIRWLGTFAFDLNSIRFW